MIAKLRNCSYILAYSVSSIIIILGLADLLLSLPIRAGLFLKLETAYSYPFQHSLLLCTGLSLILIGRSLLKRMKTSWILCFGLVGVSLCLNLLHFHRNFFVFLPEVVILFLLVMLHGQYTRDPDTHGVKTALRLVGASVALVTFFTALGLLLMRMHFYHYDGSFDLVKHSLKLFYLLDYPITPSQTPAMLFGVHFIALFNWAIILGALFFILKPRAYLPEVMAHEKEKVRSLLKLYGDNPTSYVAMENDKKYFFGSSVPGAVAYTVIKNVAICAGDPICKESDVQIFLNEFLCFCQKNNYGICFCYITRRYVKPFKTVGFGITKCGEECMFDLDSYSLEGSKASRLRQGLRRAERLGLRVFEYEPRVQRDTALEKEMMDVSAEWFTHKKSSELTFLFGTISLSNPYDRRYFVAVDNARIVQGFIVFSPFMGGMGYIADVTRRKQNAPFGVMEKLTVDAFSKMRCEGVKWGSLGLVPFYNVKDDENTGMLNSAFDYIYENCNKFYGFKSLYQYKNKYAPTVTGKLKGAKNGK